MVDATLACSLLAGVWNPKVTALIVHVAAMSKLHPCTRPLFFCSAAVACWTVLLGAQMPHPIRNADGVSLMVAPQNTQPTLRVVLPDGQDTNPAIEIIFPEHVTARKHGSTESEHLYLFQPGRQGEPPTWQQVGQSIQYERDFKGGIHTLARATLEDDGILFHYEFLNRSNAAYDMIYAVTDPRLVSIFHDVRLERTYVHHKDGFDLLASETPGRLTMPLNQCCRPAT